MAKTWQQLAPATRARKEAYYRIHEGLSPEEVARGYDSSNLPDLGRSSGHATKEQVIQQIQDYKRAAYSDRPRWNPSMSLKAIRVNQETGKNRTDKDLRKILAYIRKLAKEPTRFSNMYIELPEEFGNVAWYN